MELRTLKLGNGQQQNHRRHLPFAFWTECALIWEEEKHHTISQSVPKKAGADKTLQEVERETTKTFIERPREHHQVLVFARLEQLFLPMTFCEWLFGLG